MPTDWVAWHGRYASEASFQRRLALVQGHISAELTRAAGAELRVIDLCAGDGRALLGVLAAHSTPHVTARLVERDARLVRSARDRVRRARLTGIEVVKGDAGRASAYDGSVPARLVLVCGVFGHLTDAGIERLIGLLPMLCAPDAAVVWTRHRRKPDLVPAIRRWFAASGFIEITLDAIADSHATVGLARLARPSDPFRPDVRLFDFCDDD